MAAFLDTRKERYRTFAVFLLAGLISLTPLSALDPQKSLTQFIHNFWTSGSGFPENKIQALAQTEDGYLWFGTQHGLLRFNGNQFKVFDEFNTPAMRYSSIICLHSSRGGGLWIGTMGGGLIFFDKGKFSVFDLEDNLSSNFITALKESREGILWIGTENHGLNVLKEGKIFRVESAGATQIRQVVEDNAGNVWLATNEGLLKYTGGHFDVTPQRFELENAHVSSILADHPDKIWIGTEGRGLFLFSEGRVQRTILTNILRQDVIHTLMIDKDGALWIGTRGGLLRYYEGNVESFRVSDGLSNNEVLSLLEDREGSIWIGTHYGLNRLKERNIQILDTETGLSVDPVWTVFEDRENNLWVGTLNGGLSKVSGKRVQTFTVDTGLPSNTIRSLYQDSSGDLWIGTLKGLARMRPDGKVLNIYGRRNGLENEIVRVVYRDKSGTLWLGTNNGLFRMEGNRFSTFPLVQDASQIMVFCIKEDKAGGLWLGTHKGAFKVTKKGPEAYASDTALGDTLVLDIFFDNENHIWLATPRGLVHGTDKGFSWYQRKDGLLDNMIYSVIMDRDSNIWMSSNQGIFSFKKDELLQYDRKTDLPMKPRIYDLNDGMKSLECNGGSQPSSLLTENNILWFPTMRGAVGIDQNKQKFSGVSLPLLIEEILVDDKPVSRQSALALEPGTRKIEFRYAALTFLYPEKTEYKTILEHFEDHWVERGNKNAVYYTNLPPGNYIFRVKASRGGGHWTEPGASFSFSQKPYFHQTFLFYLVCLLGALVFGVILSRLRVRHLTRREKHLKAQIGKQTLQLEKANKELERLTIQDHLTGIFNHRMFSQFLNYEWKRAVRRNYSISLIMIDIDHFKLFNDTYGHVAGDECLKQVAHSLKNAGQRSSDMVARYGGEEFVMVLSETDDEGAFRVAEKARHIVENLKIPHETSPLSPYLTISLGCATIKPQRNLEPSLLIKAADEALYLSKQKGRNRTTKIDPATYKSTAP